MVWMYHVLFICSSVDGPLCCLHFFAILDNAAVNSMYVDV